jgi:sugar-phosphatase
MTTDPLRAKAFLVDMDGTLVDSVDATERAWATWAAEYGQDPAAVVAVCHGRRTEDTVAEFLPRGEWAAANARLDELEVGDTRGVSALPGAAELLARLEPGTWALVTSATVPLMQARMKAAGLSLPDVVVTAEDVELGKPDPQGYLLAAASLGVRPEECVVLEDSPAGVTAGKAARAYVVAIGDEHAPGLDRADVAVDSVAALIVSTTREGYDIRTRSRTP